jgi:hypothetical protein
VGVAVVVLVLAVGKIRVVMCVVVFPWGFLVFQFSTREVLLGFACQVVWLRLLVFGMVCDSSKAALELFEGKRSSARRSRLR